MSRAWRARLLEELVTGRSGAGKGGFDRLGSFEGLSAPKSLEELKRRPADGMG